PVQKARGLRAEYPPRVGRLRECRYMPPGLYLAASLDTRLLSPPEQVSCKPAILRAYCHMSRHSAQLPQSDSPDCKLRACHRRQTSRERQDAHSDPAAKFRRITADKMRGLLPKVRCQSSVESAPEDYESRDDVPACPRPELFEKCLYFLR